LPPQDCTVTEEVVRARAATVLDAGNGPVLLICDHASNHVPSDLSDLGLAYEQLNDHIGWDIGASALTQMLANLMSAPAVLANFSRLVIDANRDPAARDLVPAVSDGIVIPGNTNLTSVQRNDRISAFHRPFHDCVANLIETRKSQMPIKAIVSIHSFTPQMKSGRLAARPWHVGLLFNRDAVLANAVHAQCSDEPDLVIGLNEPYAPTDGVYYTIDRHNTCGTMLNLLVEVRNDLLATREDIEAWAHRLARWLNSALATLWAADDQNEFKDGLLTQ
jgi:predicted N-formylglutamate amidohydrolase